jgi:hypothetical protein
MTHSGELGFSGPTNHFPVSVTAPAIRSPVCTVTLTRTSAGTSTSPGCTVALPGYYTGVWDIQDSVNYPANIDLRWRFSGGMVVAAEFAVVLRNCGRVAGFLDGGEQISPLCFQTAGGLRVFWPARRRYRRCASKLRSDCWFSGRRDADFAVVLRNCGLGGHRGHGCLGPLRLLRNARGSLGESPTGAFSHLAHPNPPASSPLCRRTAQKPRKGAFLLCLGRCLVSAHWNRVSRVIGIGCLGSLA